MTDAEVVSLSDRQAIVERFRRSRARSAAIFAMVRPESRLSRPIALRHPILFYEGHIPAFYVNTILKRGLGRAGVDERLERLFARGIDPDSQAAAEEKTIRTWPERAELDAFVAEADRVVEQALQSAELDQPGNPVLRGAQGVWASLEHEEMHQETLLYILHQLPFGQKIRPASGPSPSPGDGRVPVAEWIEIPAGHATLGADDEGTFGWDNEFPAHRVRVPTFRIARFKTTNREWLEFMDAGGYQRSEWWRPDDWSWVQRARVVAPPFWVRRGDAWAWRGQFEELPLPLAWPVYVTQAEACAYSRWKGGRLPTEAEYHRAAFATSSSGEERAYPWGEAPPDSTRGHFDFAGWDPAPVGSHPAGSSAFGVDELMGNGWEWTSSFFEPFAGFAPMPSYPEYSADFFDGSHYVMKGASPVTARGLLRRSLRNWFRPQYPYVYASFRVVSGS